MATTYTPATNVPPVANYVLPDDGEEISFASLMAAIVEPLADGIGYLAAHIATDALTLAYTWSLKQTFTTGIEVASGGLATILGTLSTSKAKVQTIGAIPDADSSITTSTGFYVLAAAATVQRNLTLLSTSGPTPIEGQYIDLRADAGGAASWVVKREDATAVCTLTFDATKPACARVYWNGSVWKLRMYSEKVTPGAGA